MFWIGRCKFNAENLVIIYFCPFILNLWPSTKGYLSVILLQFQIRVYVLCCPGKDYH